MSHKSWRKLGRSVLITGISMASWAIDIDNKKPGFRRVVLILERGVNAYAPSTFTACAKREILREAVLR